MSTQNHPTNSLNYSFFNFTKYYIKINCYNAISFSFVIAFQTQKQHYLTAHISIIKLNQTPIWWCRKSVYLYVIIHSINLCLHLKVSVIPHQMMLIVNTYILSRALSFSCCIWEFISLILSLNTWFSSCWLDE